MKKPTYKFFTRPVIQGELEATWKNLGGSRYRRHGAIMAFEGKAPVGIFQYNIEKFRGQNILIADGTAVVENKRKHGIATELWTRAIKREKPSQVQVCVTSPGGTSLVRSVKKKFSKITWDVW